MFFGNWVIEIRSAFFLPGGKFYNDLMKKVMILQTLCLFFFLFACYGDVNLENFVDAQTRNTNSWEEFKKERREMVDSQIRGRGIRDGSVLKRR